MLQVSRLCHLDEKGKAGLADEVTTFCAEHPLGGHQRAMDQSLERLAVNVRFVLAQRPRLGSLLDRA
ncbi:MAG: hypothetical protein ABR925_08605, partial [Acidimicrobiales bacterium]